MAQDHRARNGAARVKQGSQAVLLGEPHENMLAEALYLLSRAATVGVCRGRMRAVIARLQSIAGDEAFPPTLRATVEKLLMEWREAQYREFGESPEADEDGTQAATCSCSH